MAAMAAMAAALSFALFCIGDLFNDNDLSLSVKAIYAV
jgi:hypothetical protein